MPNSVGCEVDHLTTEQVIDLIFKDPRIGHGLAEFADLGKKAHEVLRIYPLEVASGKAKGDIRYYVRCFKRQRDIQVYSHKKANAEEIVRQLWLYKLHHVYQYPWDHIEVEYYVQFGTVTADKPADIVVFQKDAKTAKIIVECKRPDGKDGLQQLKSYLNAEGSPVGLWSNGNDRIILYRPYPKQFDDTLTEIPRFDQEPKDVLQAPLTVGQLRRQFDFKGIIQNLQELVLAGSGYDDFTEIFKIIFAKIYDELAAQEAWDGRRNQEVQFRKTDNPDVTYSKINGLFEKAMEEWPAIFDEGDRIKLSAPHLQVCIGPLERIRLTGANMRIMDDAFEYLMPSVAKKKNGQFFTPRYVIDMCVKMLNPKRREYVLDPACGSAGFLLHTMEHVWPAEDDAKKEKRKHQYAGKYLWGFDFDERSSRVSRALMLIAGDGRSHIFRVNALDPREWFNDQEGEALRSALGDEKLLAKRPARNQVIKESEAWDYYGDMNFDVILTNPPFAGEIRDRALLGKYKLAGRALARKSKKGAKEERDVLFIERVLHCLKPGGRAGIVLPQGKFNNSSLAFIRDWILRRARLLAVVGLHPNTFKPHTGTKTSVLFIQKYTEAELKQVKSVENAVKDKAPDYARMIQDLIDKAASDADIDETDLPEEIAEALAERFAEAEEAKESALESGASADESTISTESEADTLAEEIEQKKLRLAGLKGELDEVKRMRSARKSLKGSKDKSAPARSPKDGLGATEKTLKIKCKVLEQEIVEAELELAKNTCKGRLSLLASDPGAVEELRAKWIHAKIADRLDYDVFMATADREGKNTSGEYVACFDNNGSLLEDDLGNPLIDQDCVAYHESQSHGIAEFFVAWAKKQKLTFWSDA